MVDKTCLVINIIVNSTVNCLLLPFIQVDTFIYIHTYNVKNYVKLITCFLLRGEF